MRTTRLVQRWLRVAGTLTWTVIGVTFAAFFLDVPSLLGGGVWLLWFAAFFLFLGLFWRDTDSGAVLRPRESRVASLLLQSACAFAIAGLPSKPVGFIFLTLVAAQMAGVISTRGATLWIVAQTAVMGAIYARIVPAWEAQAYVAVYLGFQAFAYMVVRAALGEAQARDDLARTHAELRAKDALLAESRRADDRARIGRDLHDVLGHHLTAMCLNLEVATHMTDGRAREHVEQAQGLARQLLDDVREVVSELRTRTGCDLGQAIASLAASLPRPAIHVDVAPEVHRVADPDLSQSLLHCAQEVMTNAARHSGADNLWLSLRRRGNGVELQARDDGRGAARVDPGGGLSGLRARFARLGGGVEIESTPQRGFTVTAWVP